MHEKYRRTVMTVFSLTLLLSASAATAYAKTRAEFLQTVKSYAEIPWTCGTGNIDVSDGYGPSMNFQAGVAYTGVPFAYYHWDTPTTFTAKLHTSYIAGRKSNATIIPSGHPGFTGTDMGGMLSRAVEITNVAERWYVADVPKSAFQKD